MNVSMKVTSYSILEFLSSIKLAETFFDSTPCQDLLPESGGSFTFLIEQVIIPYHRVEGSAEKREWIRNREKSSLLTNRIFGVATQCAIAC